MLLLLPVLALLAAVGVLAMRVLGDEHKTRKPTGTGLAVAGGLAVVVVAIAALGGLGGTASEGGRPGGQGRPSATPTSTPERPALPVVVIDARDPDRLASEPVVDRLPPGGVVRVQASGFGWFERGLIEQCVTETGRRPRCANRFPVQFDEDGRGHFQYLLVDSFAPGGCRAGEATCTLAVGAVGSSRRGAVQTVLVDRFGPGRVRVTPARDLREGQQVNVAVTGFPAGGRNEVVFCAPPGTYDAARCQSTGVPLAVAGDGTGSARVAVAVGPVGEREASCGPRRGCTVVVVGRKGFVASPAVAVGYALGPGPGYEAGRVAGGLAVALGLVAVALMLVRRTDWAKPTEATTPEMDATDLETASTLDELFGTDAELDAAYPLTRD